MNPSNRMACRGSLIVLVGLAIGLANAQPSRMENRTRRIAESAERRSLDQLRVTELKKRYTPEQLRADDRLLAEFADANARAHGLKPTWQRGRVDELLVRDSRLALGLTSDQVHAWRDVLDMGWDGAVYWDTHALTPSEIRAGMTLRGSTGEDAHADFETRFGAVLRSLFAFGTPDVLTELDVQEAEVQMPLADSPSRTIYRARYGRMHAGLPVFGDRYEVALVRSEFDPSVWQAYVFARWTRTVLRQDVRVQSDAAVLAAREVGDVPDGLLLAAPHLGYYATDDEARLAYEIEVREGRSRIRYYVSALTGEVLERSLQTADNHDGHLEAWVSRPYEDDKSPRPIPYVNIYEDTASVPAAPACYYNVNGNQTQGDPAQLKGTTDYSGDYENVMDYDPTDMNWVIDFHGIYAEDVSNYDDHTATGIPAGGEYTIPNSTDYGRNRRGEMFYLLNYGHRVYDTYFIPQYEPIGFSFDALGSEDIVESDCDEFVGPTTCCGGGSEVGCIWMECSMGPTGAPLAEKRFREVAIHEQAHTLRLKASGGFCNGCSGDAENDGTECGCWEEGRADFSAISINRFEKFRGEYSPELMYPDDYEGGIYSKGAPFTAIYVHYMLRAGLDAIGDVNRNLDQIDQSTRMVGSCASPTDWTSCPANSYFRRLITSQEVWTFPRWRNTQEISAAFHDHVTDADRATPGAQEFPWADETPNRLFNAPTIYTDFGSVDTVTATNGIEGGGALALNSADDFDTFMFKARAGETYTVGTDDLAAGVDTLLEIRTISDITSTLIDSNDDCGAGPESCVTFMAEDTGFYRIIVNPFPGTVTGPGATYSVYVELEDDIGDELDEAAAFSPDDVMHDSHGVIEGPADVDVYQITVPTAQNLGFVGCSTDGSFKVEVELRNAAGTLLKSKQNKKCNKEPKIVAVDPGNYYLLVSSPSGVTGSYGLRASLSSSDIDQDDTPGNALVLTPDDVVGTLFENVMEDDWFRIDAQAGRYYVVEAVGIDVGVDTTLEIYAPSDTMYGPEQLPDTSGHDLGHRMLADDDGGLRPLDAREVFWAPVTGAYYVRARADAGSSAGRYHLVLHDNSEVTLGYPAMP